MGLDLEFDLMIGADGGNCWSGLGMIQKLSWPVTLLTRNGLLLSEVMGH